MSTTSGCQDTRIKKIEFVARTHLLSQKYKDKNLNIEFWRIKNEFVEKKGSKDFKILQIQIINVSIPFQRFKTVFFYKKYTTYLRVSSKEDIKLQSCLVLKFLVNLDPD